MTAAAEQQENLIAIPCTYTRGDGAQIVEPIFAKPISQDASGVKAIVITSPILTDQLCFGDTVSIPDADNPGDFSVIEYSRFDSASIQILNEAARESIVGEISQIPDTILFVGKDTNYVAAAIDCSRVNELQAVCERLEQEGQIRYCVLEHKGEV